MRITVFTSSYPRYPGDATAPFVKSICENLAKLGNTVDVVAPYDAAVVLEQGDAVPVHRFRYIWPERFHIMGHARSLENDMRVRWLAYFLLPFYLLAGFFSLLKVTGRQESQIIYAHWVIPNGLVAAWVAALRGIPFILSLHGSDIFLARRNRFFGLFARWVFHRASAVTACSPLLRNTAIELGASPETRLLAYGVDPAVFSPDCRNPQAPDNIQRNGPSVRIVALGRLVSKKGFSNLLAAMRLIIDDCPEVHLNLGGDGFLKEALSRQADQLGISKHISFAGNIPWDRVPEFLANADIFVLPSVFDREGNVDGLPNVLLEAMSSGVAVVASNIGGVSLVIEHQENGLLVQPGDVAALAQACISLAKDNTFRCHLGYKARQSVLENFNWENVCKQIVDIIKLAN